RRFNSAWFDEYRNWFEYSIKKDAAFCLCCYLFKQNIRDHQGGGDSFTSERFSNWKEKEKLKKHVGGPSSIHNQTLKNCKALMNQNQYIKTIISKQSKQAVCINCLYSVPFTIRAPISWS
ncbi:Zinc finger, TTF-type, partial [Trema orientale]